MYWFGNGAPKDVDWAYELYTQAAALGSVVALVYQGRILDAQGDPRALEVLQSAADLGEVSAYTFIAEIDTASKLAHYERGAQSSNPYCTYAYAYELMANSDESQRHTHIHLMEKAARMGAPTACTYMGFQHLFGGCGFEVDIKTAKEWFAIGCKYGDMGSLVTMGRQLIKDSDLRTEGLQKLLCASLLGEALAQRELGCMQLWVGQTPEEKAQGIYWLRQAVKQNDTEAMYCLSDALRTGQGTTANPQEAIQLLELGNSLGDSDCQIALGAALMNGVLVKKDCERGHELFQIAALQGSTWAHYQLGKSYEMGTGVEKNAKKAFECFLVAAKAGYGEAMYSVGMHYLLGIGAPENKAAAVTWLKKAADQDHSGAMHSLAIMLANGDGVKSNPKQARTWFEKAAALGNSASLRELALIYKEGVGVPEDLEKARHLMARAAGLGDEPALEWIDANLPQKPEWLLNLMKPSQDAANDEELG
jgi:TPR repeat protein